MILCTDINIYVRQNLNKTHIKSVFMYYSDIFVIEWTTYKKPCIKIFPNFWLSKQLFIYNKLKQRISHAHK